MKKIHIDLNLNKLKRKSLCKTPFFLFFFLLINLIWKCQNVGWLVVVRCFSFFLSFFFCNRLAQASRILLEWENAAMLEVLVKFSITVFSLCIFIINFSLKRHETKQKKLVWLGFLAFFFLLLLLILEFEIVNSTNNIESIFESL